MGDTLFVSTERGKMAALEDISPESGSQCDNSTDDDKDGWVNEGCPKVGEKAESEEECDNDTSDETVDGIKDDEKVNDGCPAFVPQWIFPAKEDKKLKLEAIYGAPVVAEDTIYFAGYDGNVYALNREDGSQRWVSPTGGPIIGGLSLADGTIFVGSDDGKLYALEAASGRLLDSFDAGDSIWATPLLADSVLYVPSVNGKLYALDAQTLEPLWQEPFEADAGLLTDPVLADQDTLLVGGIDRTLYALDARSGEVKWSFKADNWFWGRPLVADGTIYAPSLDKRIYALDLASGDPVWDQPFEADNPVRSSPLLVGEVLIVVDRKGNVYGLNPSTGSRKWGPEILDKTVLADPMPLADSVLIVAQGGDLFRIDPAGGASSLLEVRQP